MVALAPITNDTSAWDVLNTFPKLHSRAREEKTGICTEAPASKSLGRVEIWQAVYETCDGLESFTRDPIGFEGSEWGLYEFFGGMPLVDVDPTGTTTFMQCVCRLNPVCLAAAAPCALGCMWSRDPSCMDNCVLGMILLAPGQNQGCRVGVCRGMYP